MFLLDATHVRFTSGSNPLALGSDELPTVKAIGSGVYLLVKQWNCKKPMMDNAT